MYNQIHIIKIKALDQVKEFITYQPLSRAVRRSIVHVGLRQNLSAEALIPSCNTLGYHNRDTCNQIPRLLSISWKVYLCVYLIRKITEIDLFIDSKT